MEDKKVMSLEISKQIKNRNVDTIYLFPFIVNSLGKSGSYYTDETNYLDPVSIMCNEEFAHKAVKELPEKFLERRPGKGYLLKARFN